MTKQPAPRQTAEIADVAASVGYRELIDRLQRRVRESQARAARALNTELVMLYWSIGRDILEQQQAAGWGDDIVGRASRPRPRRRRGPRAIVAEYAGKKDFYRDTGGNLGHSNTCPGPDLMCHGRLDAVTLDAGIERWLWTRVRVVKIDVEGDEFCVLQGMHRLLDAMAPGAAVLVEVTSHDMADRGHTATDLFEYMAARRFAPFAQSGTVIGTGQMRGEVREQGAPMRSVSPFRPGIADSGANGRIQQ